MKYSDTTVIIPTLNEEKNIGGLIRVIRDSYSGIKVIVADDGSKDNTQRVVKGFKDKDILLLDRSKEDVKGLTASVIDAVKVVKTKYLVVIDADLQHPPEKISEIAEKLRKGFDIVVATREKIEEDWPLSRRLLSKAAILAGKLRLAVKGKICNDIVSGFAGVKTKLFKGVLENKEEKFEKEGYKFLFELLKYCPTDTKIAEVGYSFNVRKEGISKVSKKVLLAYCRSLFK